MVTDQQGNPVTPHREDRLIRSGDGNGSMKKGMGGHHPRKPAMQPRNGRAADSEQMGREAKGQARTERQEVQDGELRRALLDVGPAMGGDK